VGQHAVGFPQFAVRANSDLVVLQGQGFEDEVSICKVRAIIRRFNVFLS
jgi:hypothetical protein